MLNVDLLDRAGNVEHTAKEATVGGGSEDRHENLPATFSELFSVRW
jgi:hypothetical protein